MRTRFFRCVVLSAVLASFAPGAARAAVNADPAYVVGSLPLPAVVAADVAVAGTAVLAGQGPFGVGLQSIVRRDADGTTTTIVSGLNALGGLAYDAAGDRLLFTDNAGDLGGATHGDTVYALPSPLSVASPVAASTLALLPSGSIPFAQAVLPLAGGDILIGDAAGPGAGRVVKLAGGVPTNLISGLDYTAGVSLTLVGGELLVGNVDAFFAGAIKRYSLAGVPTGTLAGGLSGALDQALDSTGNLLVTGGFTFDFSSSTVVSISPAGVVDEIATGFGFSSGITIDGPSRQVMVLDFGATEVETLTPIDAMTPAGFGSQECHLETWGGAPERSGSGKPKTRWSCTDGDVTCDRDGAVDGSCTFLVGACFTVTDPRAPRCTPANVATITVTSRTLPAAAGQIQTAAATVLPTTGAACSLGTAVAVAADKKTRTLVFDAAARAKRLGRRGKHLDSDTLKLRCLP